MQLGIVALLVAAAGLAATPPACAADPAKVFRYAFEIAESSLDPQRISDVYSNIVNAAMYDPPLRYDYLARPLKLRPNTLASMPEISADGLTYTLRVKPGIHFADDPVFNGKKRELVAEDYVYSIKRLMDPKLAAPLLSEVEGIIVGSDEALAKARKANRFDYDAPIEGLKALDRYTFQIKLTQPFYVFIYNLADCRVSCAVAREMVEHYGDDFGSHPVGTGPYRLAFWKRSSKLVFEANPDYREEYFDGEPGPDDAEGQAILAVQRGKRLPMVGKVEVYIIEEVQPRWLAFLNEEHDLAFRVSEEFANVAMPNNRLAPNLRKRGIRMAQVPALDLTFAYFNMEDPVVGGYTPEKVALRRAISLAYNTGDEIAIVRKNQAVPAHTPYSPGVAGYDPDFRTGANEYSIAKSRALLDMFGYLDRDGDGYREMPDGSPLVLRNASTPSARDQQVDELWKRSMDDVGLRMTFKKAKWPDLLKESDAGKLMMWQLGGAASAPDADTWLTSLYGPNAGFKGNRARFRLDAYDRLYEQARVMPDGPQRTRIYQQMTKLVVAYAPWKVNVHRILTDMWYPWVVGYRRPLVQSSNFWKYIDIDLSKRPPSSR
ncbi:MAG TPA: ABC transporter substrate-binding protein [Usitatibacteraceae bacterium]|nr:ABC transporter substrate-binding protein [Usitatibacteraceae bacterium]